MPNCHNVINKIFRRFALFIYKIDCRKEKRTKKKTFRQQKHGDGPIKNGDVTSGF